MTVSTYIRYTSEGPKELPIIPRPCFSCGKMMEIILAVKQLTCLRCDVTEAADPITYVKNLAATAASWQGMEVPYIDHGIGYAPTP